MMIPFGVLCAGVCVPADLDELEVCFGGTKSVFHRILLQDDALQWKKKRFSIQRAVTITTTVPRVHKKKKKNCS